MTNKPNDAKADDAAQRTADEEELELHEQKLRHHANRVREVALAGAAAGAATGALAGPPGALAGAVIVGIAGAIAGEAMDEQADRDEAHDQELDEEIGVMGGDIGARGEETTPGKTKPRG